jgi:alanine dehydrogenase
MPGGVPKPTTHALNDVTLPFLHLILPIKALFRHFWMMKHLRVGLNVHSGKITCPEVVQDLSYEYVSALDVLNN